MNNELPPMQEAGINKNNLVRPRARSIEPLPAFGGNTTVILAHGVLGFGAMNPHHSIINYFNGVALHLRGRGINVLEPGVNPVGSIEERGTQLADFILNNIPEGTKAHILAHSMGGLDSRHALTHVQGVSERITTLVTIGTPHKGSPVADAIAKGSGKLLQHIPLPLAEQLRNSLPALENLTTDFCAKFDSSTSDVKSVRYIEVAGNALLGGRELFLFEIAAMIGGIHNVINDGVVTKESALRDGHEHLPDWPVDHAGEIGWSISSPLPIEIELPLIPKPAHFGRYDAIVDML